MRLFAHATKFRAHRPGASAEPLLASRSIVFATHHVDHAELPELTERFQCS